MNWRLSHRYDPGAAALADRHYNRRTHGSPQFSPPGRLIVLRAERAVWTTIAQRHAKHRWPGAWMNSIFRREAGPLASILITDACSATRALWGDPPAIGMISFIDREKIQNKAAPGYCYWKAGFEPDGLTEGGLLAFRLPGDRFPPPVLPIGSQLGLWGGAMNRASEELRQEAVDARHAASLLQRQIDVLTEMGLHEHASDLRRQMGELLRIAVEKEEGADRLDRQRYRAERECTSGEPLHPRAPAPRLPGEQ